MPHNLKTPHVGTDDQGMVYVLIKRQLFQRATSLFETKHRTTSLCDFIVNKKLWTGLLGPSNEHKIAANN